MHLSWQELRTVTLAQAQIRTPSDPGYVPTAPPALDRNAAMDLLVRAGYNIEPDVAPPSPPGMPPPPGHDRLVKDGKPLGLAIGVAANDPTSVAVANTAADQLRSVGIEATVLAMDPVAMLFDEPTSALDPEMIQEVLDVMVGLAKEGMTMMCVTHEMGFAKQVANKVVFMDAGQIVEDCSTEEFFGSPRSERAQQFLSKILNH